MYYATYLVLCTQQLGSHHYHYINARIKNIDLANVGSFIKTSKPILIFTDSSLIFDGYILLVFTSFFMLIKKPLVYW